MNDFHLDAISYVTFSHRCASPKILHCSLVCARVLRVCILFHFLCWHLIVAAAAAHKFFITLNTLNISCEKRMRLETLQMLSIENFFGAKLNKINNFDVFEWRKTCSDFSNSLRYYVRMDPDGDAGCETL